MTTVVALPELFGSAQTCLHIHGIFPYMYVPKPKGEVGDGYIYQLAASIDKALNISFMSADSAGKSNSNLQHVYKASRKDLLNTELHFF